MALPSNFFYFTRSRTTGAVTIYKTPATPVVDQAQLQKWGITLTGRRPCINLFKGEVHIAGAFSRPIYYPVQDPAWAPVAIRPPANTIGVGTSGTGTLQGVALCYITFQHRIGDVVLAESNPSNVVQIDQQGKAARTWSNLTDVTRDSRVTHIAGYCSVNGSNYRRAFVTPYGMTAYSEGVPTNSLTVEGPTTNYLPPAGAAFATPFANRMWYANTSEFPYRVWYSAPGQGQYVGLSSYVDTLDRDEVQAIAGCQGVMIVFTIDKAYAVRASGLRYTIDRLDRSFGCVSHFGCVEIHNKLWFPTQDGIAIYDGGGFYYLMKDMRPYYQADYLENQDAFRRSYAVNEKIGKNYLLMTQREQRDAFEDWNPGSVIYVGNYLNFERSLGGQNEQPDWSIDLRNRIDYSAFYGLDNRLYFGGEDGALRIEDPDDPDDDGDSIQKALLIEHGLMLFTEPGDDPEQGKTLQQLWSYMEAEHNSWTFYAIMGDEWAELQWQPDNVVEMWKIDVAASALTQVVPDPLGGTMLATYIPETNQHFGPPDGLSGRGLLARVRAVNPVRMKYRGYGGVWAAGPAPRKPQAIIRTTLFRVEEQPNPDEGGPPTIFVPIEVPPNTAAAPISIPSGVATEFYITLNSAPTAYPVPVSFDWTGAHVESQSDPIASGLTSGPVGAGVTFTLTAGLSELTVTATVDGNPLEKAYYFDAV